MTLRTNSVYPKSGTMNRRKMLRLSLGAALMGTAMNPKEVQATQTVAAKPISLPELPPKPPKDIAPKLFPGFLQTEVRTSGATIPVLHKGDGRSEEHTSELQSRTVISYAVFCLKKKKQ